MTNQLKPTPYSSLISGIALAAILGFTAAPVLASPGHDNDAVDHEMDESCMDHEGMSKEEHDKGHDEGADDCDMDKDHDDGEDSDHQH